MVTVLNKQIKNGLKSATSLPYKVFLGLFLLSLLIFVMAMRNNNQTMVQLRDAVYEADKDDGDVGQAVNELRLYVYSHMNTDLSSGGNAIKPPIQLKHTYERLQAAEKRRVDAVNEKIYTEAQAYCELQNPTSFSGGSRVPCIENYVSKNGAKANIIPAGLYQFDFVSPSWSPDLAGWSMVLTGFLFMCLLISVIQDKWLKLKSSP